MRAVPITLAIIALCLAGAPAAQGQFTPGHIFIAGTGDDGNGCEWGDPETVLEIDPVTGEVWNFVPDCSYGIAGIGGLRFTPNGRQLLALNAGTTDERGWIQAFNPDGTSEIILDESDGLVRPVGHNGLAFDRAGNLYVVDRARDEILRFPADGGPTEVFADAEDGIRDFGALGFAPNGDLFYAGATRGNIIRITPEGEGSVFDVFEGEPYEHPYTLALDSQGNIFVGINPPFDPFIYRYDKGDPTTRAVLVVDLFPGGIYSMTFADNDDSVLYVAGVGRQDRAFLVGVDPVGGSVTPLAVDGPGHTWVYPFGIAVAPPIFGDMDEDLDVDLDDFAAFDACVSGPSAPVAPECAVADLDRDNDVDFADFGLMQSAYGIG